MTDIDCLSLTLNAFDETTRGNALRELLRQRPDRPPEKPWVNMHMHSFFSYNGEGHSPSRLAWDARQAGLYALGICDFDVLDGLHELYEAADLLEMRATVGFESRTFFEEFGDREINSPGEPGVFYFMGMGFAAPPAADAPAGGILADMLARSHRRNRALIDRVNAKLDGLELDYDRDVLPKTPAGNATERHIVLAYHEKALRAHRGHAEATAEFWARQLDAPTADLHARIQNTNAFADLLRSKLIKRGGIGYEQPTSDTFPMLDDVIRMILESSAVPTTTWLDGASPGEADPDAQLDCLMGKGVAAVNIIPDRNWNIADSREQARKVGELQRYASAAIKRGLPILVGTELNKPGQRFVDDFNAAPLKPLAPAFLDGARILIGHTRLLRYAAFSYTGKDAANQYPDRKQRNQAFAALGALPAPPPRVREKLEGMTTLAAFNYLQDSARAGAWG